MKERMNRKQISIGNAEQLEKNDKLYWTKTSVDEKLKTITYLRECFYGDEATAGRLERVYKIFKRK